MKPAAALLLICGFPFVLTGQSTQGVITGVVQNRSTGAAIPHSYPAPLLLTESRRQIQLSVKVQF